MTKFRRFKTSAAIVVTVGALCIPLSCTLNPLNGLLTGISVKIISPSSGKDLKVKAKASEIQTQALVPVTVAYDLADYDCVAFNSTGYGIDNRETPDSEFPISFFEFGAETPMQSPQAVTNSVFNVEFPTVIGVDPNLQARLIRAYGVFTSNADKSFCLGKKLSDFLINDDPYASVYRIGSGNYPSSDGSCPDSDLCITNETKEFQGDVELINDWYGAVRGNLPTKTYEWSNGMFYGISLFENSDIDAGGSIQISNNSTATADPLSNGKVSRVDLFFEVSDQYVGRFANFNLSLDFTSINAKLYQSSGGLCTGTPTGSYSQISVKYWDGTNLQWASIPRRAGFIFSDVLSAANHSSGYTIDSVDLANVNRATVDGKKYFIVSIRANNTSCAKLEVSPFAELISNSKAF